MSKTFDQIREGIAGAVAGGVVGSAAGPVGTAAGAYLGHKVQQAANAAKKKKDDHKPTTIGPDGKQKHENSDAVKAFLAKGGKIKKLPPGKAQGYHGKDDPGKGVHGMMDKPDSKRMGTRKKVRSMESAQVNELDTDTLISYRKKANKQRYSNDVSKRPQRTKGVDRADKKLAKRGVDKFGNKHESVNEEMMFKVNVEGLPPMIMLGKSPGDIKGQLRKIVKQPSMIGDIDRMTKAEVKKRYRDMGAGKEDKE